jgi:hypothetical protein
MADKISMADLLASNLATDWFEAVSLVREVCAVLISERIQDSTPELGQILLGPTGRITITGTAHGDAPVRRLGQLLQALLRSTEPPVTLRRVLSEAMAEPPVYPSVTELDAALAYFERPDRYVVLKALYERASKAEISASAVAPVQDLDVIAPLPVSEPAKPKKARKPANTRATAYVAAAAVMLAAAAFAFQRGALTLTGSAVDKAVLTTVSAASELAGMGKLVDSDAVVDVPQPPAPVAPTSRWRSGAGARVYRVTLAGVPVKLLDLQPATDGGPALDSPASVSSAVLEASAEPNRVVDTRLYGPEDQNVAAPVALRPHLPTPLPDRVDLDQLARIELVVARDGIVESVKLVPGKSPVTVNEAMLLSAAKAWRFTPAMKGEYPVKYRKTVFLSEK